MSKTKSRKENSKKKTDRKIRKNSYHKVKCQVPETEELQLKKERLVRNN